MRRSMGRTARVCLSVLVGGLMWLAGCDDDTVGDPCGNEQIDSGEQCDGINLNGMTCDDVGNYSGGILSCTSTCTFETGMCTAPLGCGDGSINGGEDCDGAELGGQTCSGLGLGFGTLACANDCSFDTSGCGATGDCGNGQLDGTEQCDGMNLDGKTCADVGDFSGGSLACDGTCTFDTSGCTPVGDDCPRDTLSSLTSVVYDGDTTGLPNLVTSSRLEWEDAPDDSLSFTAPVAGDYEIVTRSEPSSNGGCGASVWDYGTDSYYDASWCPAPGTTSVLDGFYTSAGYPYHFEAGETVVIFFSCTYWADVQYGPYQITIDLQ